MQLLLHFGHEYIQNVLLRIYICVNNNVHVVTAVQYDLIVTVAKNYPETLNSTNNATLEYYWSFTHYPYEYIVGIIIMPSLNINITCFHYGK